MKRVLFNKIIVILLAVVMVLPLTAFTISAAEPPIDTTVRDRIDSMIIKNGATPEDQSEMASLAWQLGWESDLAEIKAYVKEQERLAEENKSAAASKEKLENIQEGLNVVKENLPGFINFIKDATNGGDFDTAAMLDSTFSLVSDIVSCLGPYGKMAGAAIEIFNTVFTALMGGEAATSELAQMEDRLSQQLDEIQDQLSDIEAQVSELSDKINESTNTIISGVTTAIDNADAKQYLRTFMLSGEGNFSYNEYRNYIIGTIKNNAKADTAYYAWIKYYEGKENSDKLVKEYYDLLYKSIMDGWHEYYDYLVGTDTGKSIVQYYYDVVSANPALLDGTGRTPRVAAIMFAYDLYQTELMIDQMIEVCNFYQYSYIATTAEGDPNAIYVYDKSSSGGFETVDKLLTKNSETIMKRVEDIEAQLAKDLAYVFELTDSYVVEYEDGKLHPQVKNDPDTFGFVLPGERVFLNVFPEDVINLFKFNKRRFSTDVSVFTRTEGVFLVEDTTPRTVTVDYRFDGKSVASMTFTVGAGSKFNGGTGTAADPYLIASAEQFKAIGAGLDKHYRLIADIDMGGATISPFGQRVNGNNNVVYDEFTGSLDGGGYTVKNLNVVGYSHAGLFGIIGVGAEVADLTLYNVKVSSKVAGAEKSVSEFYAGMIAGKNNGVIKYCNVGSDGTTVSKEYKVYSIPDLLPHAATEEQKHLMEALIKDGITDIRDARMYQLLIPDVKVNKATPTHGVFIEVENEVKNRIINVYAGGIAGVNNDVIALCTVADVHVSASSTHDFGGDATQTNKNSVLAGGIAGSSNGTVAYSSVKSTAKISAFAKSVYNPKTTVNPYVTALAGGIAAKVKTLDNVFGIESDAEIVLELSEIKSESGWAEGYKNCVDEGDRYVPKHKDDDLKKTVHDSDVDAYIESTRKTYTVTYGYGSSTSGNYPETVYEAGSTVFNVKDLKFYVNGVKRDHEIVDLYGFDTYNDSLTSTEGEAVVLFKTVIDGRYHYFTENISFTVGANTVKKAEVTNLKSSYVQNTFSPLGLVIKFTYALGNVEYVTVNADNLGDFTVSGNVSDFGERELTLEYKGERAVFSINVVCNHGSNFLNAESGYEKRAELSLAPTCSALGYDTYKCKTCGDEERYYLRKTEHTPVYSSEREATCLEEGYTGNVVCQVCSATLREGKAVPKLSHSYKYYTESSHICKNGNHTEYHHYTVSESVQFLDPDGNGVYDWYAVYTYTCVCEGEDGKPHTKTVIDENRITAESGALPTVAVSGGYVLNGGDTVTVYVQLINNPGIKAANFGIRYSEGLELIGTPLKGELFRGIRVEEYAEVNHGYNFVLAGDTLVEGDGNLLKLTFKVSDTAHLYDTFPISVVYSDIGETVDGKQVKGGFSNGNMINVVTVDGFVKVVNELPGDVNKDGCVDLMDAVLLAKFYVNSEEYPLESSAADINLDRSITPDDIVALLEYLVGGHGTNLMTEEFDILLNTNGFGEDHGSLHVSIYGNNSTYGEAGLPTLERDGYRFLGWYDTIVGGNRVTEGGSVVYNPEQRKQTLYARWEMNKLSFEPSGATAGTMPDVYYTDDLTVSVENKYGKEYKIAFISDNSAFDDERDVMRYTVLYWEGSNGVTYHTLDEAVRDLKNGHYGTVTLTPVWSETPEVNYPDWMIEGYDELVEWYGSPSFTSVTRIEKGDDIFNYATENGYYLVYAKHTLIEYDIVFDFGKDEHGNFIQGIVPGSSNNSLLQNYSVEKPYPLSGISVNYAGNAISGWTVYVDGVFFDDYKASELVQVSYLPGVKEGSVITLMPSWNEVFYDLIYILNDGNDTTVKESFSLKGLDSLTLLLPEYPKRPEFNTFVGWYTDPSFSQRFDKEAVKANPKAVTLYAKWDKCDEEYFHTSTPDKITYKRVIIDWSNLTGVIYDANKSITLQNVKDVYIIGNPDVKYNGLTLIVGADNPDYTTPSIHLISFNVTGAHICTAADSLDIDLTVTAGGEQSSLVAKGGTSTIVGFRSISFKGDGKLTIWGGKGTDATNNGVSGTDGAIAIVTGTLTVDMTGTLTVYGGNGGNGMLGATLTTKGANGKNGGNGGNGAVAISASSVNIVAGTVEIYGGTGGHGGNGGNGVKGTETSGTCKNDNNTSHWCTGANGGKGGNGGAGGAGGNGALAITATAEVKASGSSTVLIVAGAGGDGGNGGAGGAGGKGQNGAKGWTSVGAEDGHDGGNGGAGGTGGNGGHGGMGGAQITNVTAYGNAVITVSSGNNGDGGDGGTGGNGGNGGNGGASAENWIAGHIWGGDGGNGGAAADGGIGGNGHEAGEGGTAGTRGARGTRGCSCVPHGSPGGTANDGADGIVINNASTTVYTAAQE